MTDQINTPELRFPNYKDSWFSYKLNDISERVTRKNKNLESQRPLTISGQLGLIDQIEYFNKSVSSKNLTGYTLIKKGEFAYNKSYSNGYPLGAIKKLERYDLGILSSLYICFSFNKNIDKNFMKNYFESTKWYREVANIAVEGARNHGLLNIPVNDFFNININLPIQYEQEKIGNFFSKLDRQIELEEKKLELLEQQKRGYMQKIFTQELKFKNSQLENIKWSYKTLEELNSFFTDGNYGESYPKSEDMSDKNDGVAFLRGSNLKKGRITLEDANYISKKKHSELTTGHLFLDDIVIAVRGSLGAVGYVNENMVGNNINSQLAIIRTSDSLLYGKYLLYYLMSNQGKKELLSRVTGTALKQLPIKQIKQIKVPVPKLYEQHKIANFLSELDNLIDNQTEKIELLKERNKGFLQKMFV